MPHQRSTSSPIPLLIAAAVLLGPSRAWPAEPAAALGRLETVPPTPSRIPDDNRLQAWLKPGHWTATFVAAEAKHRDVLAALELSAIDAEGRPLPLAARPYGLVVGRPAALARRHLKRLQSVLIVGDPGEPVRVRARLISRSEREPSAERLTPLGLMPSYQYHLVVLAGRPRPYRDLDRLPSIRPPSDALVGPAGAAHYRVCLADPTRPASLPELAARWSSIAHVIWDDWPAGRLTGGQQQAMLDWLHFGGGLIVSGPGSLDRLRGSFLEPYLPARRTGPREFGTEQLAALADWREVDGGRRLRLSQPIAGVELELTDPVRARFLPRLGRMFAERRVGRGRVIVSAVPLSDPRLTRWPGWDDLVNACLLRRPPRRFSVNELGGAEVHC
ncbi:MAG: hypothetical protein ACOC46_02815, partial [Pirellulales bacterium]